MWIVFLFGCNYILDHAAQLTTITRTCVMYALMCIISIYMCGALHFCVLFRMTLLNALIHVCFCQPIVSISNLEIRIVAPCPPSPVASSVDHMAPKTRRSSASQWWRGKYCAMAVSASPSVKRTRTSDAPPPSGGRGRGRGRGHGRGRSQSLPEPPHDERSCSQCGGDWLPDLMCFDCMCGDSDVGSSLSENTCALDVQTASDNLTAALTNVLTDDASANAPVTRTTVRDAAKALKHARKRRVRRAAAATPVDTPQSPTQARASPIPAPHRSPQPPRRVRGKQSVSGTQTTLARYIVGTQTTLTQTTLARYSSQSVSGPANVDIRSDIIGESLSPSLQSPAPSSPAAPSPDAVDIPESDYGMPSNPDKPESDDDMPLKADVTDDESDVWDALPDLEADVTDDESSSDAPLCLPGFRHDKPVEPIESAEPLRPLSQPTGEPVPPPSAPPPCYNPDNVKAFYTAICECIELCLEPDELALVKAYLSRQLYENPVLCTFGTSCSGSDNISDWIREFGDHIGQCILVQRFACDTDDTCRTFIRDRNPLIPHCFADAASLGCRRAADAWDPRLLPVSIPNVGFFLFGFVCTDLSARNQKLSENLQTPVCATGSLRSGSTWQYNLNYIREHQPEHGIAENVANILVECKEAAYQECKSNLEVCQRDLSSAGYNSIALLLSPHEFCVPEHRWRVFILYSRVLAMERLQSVASLIETWKHHMCRLPLDSFLLAPDDPLIESSLQDRLAAASASSESSIRASATQKWNSQRRRRVGATKRHNYTDSSKAAFFPWLDTLLPRELAQLQNIPESVKARLADISQNSDFACLSRADAHELVQCITKLAKLWDFDSHRVLLGLEVAAIQGIAISRDEASRYSDLMLSQLAGNAFCGPLVLTLLIAMLLVAAQLDNDSRSAVVENGVAPSATLASSPSIDPSPSTPPMTMHRGQSTDEVACDTLASFAALLDDDE